MHSHSRATAAVSALALYLGTASYRTVQGTVCETRRRASDRAKVLLDKSDTRRRRRYVFLDGAELRFIAGNIFAQRAPKSFRVAGPQDYAGHDLAVRRVRVDVDKVQRELFRVVMNHR